MATRSPGVGSVKLECVEGGVVDRHGYRTCDVAIITYSYPLKLLVPEYASETNCKWIYPITFGGGLVAGDRIDLHLAVGRECSALLTSQESTKIYHCDGCLVTQQDLEAVVSQDALLSVLPDPIVCYQDADFTQKQTFRLSGRSGLALLDWMTAGRMALDERWQFKRFVSRTEIYIEDQLVFRDSVSLKNIPALSIKQSMKNYQVMGTFILLGNKFEKASSKMKDKIGRIRSFGERADPARVWSISPLTYHVCDPPVCGVYVRFLATDTTVAYSMVREIISELTDILGGDPFSHKY
ncbi:hypothetical protein ScPMuIL_008584 [Solemya velum]